MNSIIKKDIIRILVRVTDAIKKKDSSEIELLSNRINHNSSIFQDEDSLTIAIVVYSISKLMQQNKRSSVGAFLLLFRKAKQLLDTDNYDSYRETIKIIIDRIKELDSGLRRYIIHIYNQAEIKKGSKLFYNGISLPRVAELLNLSQWELLSYVGKTNITDTFAKDKGVKKRIHYTRTLFM